MSRTLRDHSPPSQPFSPIATKPLPFYEHTGDGRERLLFHNLEEAEGDRAKGLRYG